jgi:hypothetical protein
MGDDRSTDRGRDAREEVPTLAFGFRGEDIHYHLGSRDLTAEFTWVGGARLYPGSIRRWRDGMELTSEEKAKVFQDLLRFIADTGEPTIVVVNRHDPSRAIWETASSAPPGWVTTIEYTSESEQRARERAMFLSTLRAGKGLSIDGVEIRDELQLDAVLDARHRDGGGSRVR